MPKKQHLDKDGKTELPPYIYWNKRFRRYEARAYVEGKEHPLGWYVLLRHAVNAQKKFIENYRGNTNVES